MAEYRELYKEGAEALKAAGITEYELDSRLLLEYVCATDRNTLLAHPDMQVDEDNENLFLECIDRRKKRIPLQHITGTQDFMGLTFKVNNSVLVPRQDTECLAEEVMAYAEDGMRVLDLCTGSGCILLSLMHYRYLEGYGCDVSGDALKVAQENAELLKIEPQPVLKEGDLFEPVADLKGYFDVIVSNPPYIKSDVIGSLMPEVRDHDPMLALDGGPDGLDFYRRIADKAPEYLTNYGRLFLEIGFDQKKEIISILSDAGFTDIEVKDDLGGNPRVAVAKYIRKTLQ